MLEGGVIIKILLGVNDFVGVFKLFCDKIFNKKLSMGKCGWVLNCLLLKWGLLGIFVLLIFVIV